MLAIVPGDRTVRRLGLHRLAVGCQQHRGHHAERSETLRQGVRLHVAVIIFAGPDKAAIPLERQRDHVVDQAMLVGQIALLECAGEFALEHLLEDVPEAAVIGLENRVLGRQVERPTALQREVEAGAGKASDRVVEIVHTHRDTAAVELEDLAHPARHPPG